MVVSSLRNLGHRAQILVEFVVILPFLLLIVLGAVIDFGFVFYNYGKLQQIANETAEFAAEGNGKIGITSTGILGAFVQNRKPRWWTGVITLYPPDVRVAEDSKIIKITLSYESRMITPFYRSMMTAYSGSPSIRLVSSAAYKVPKVLLNR